LYFHLTIAWVDCVQLVAKRPPPAPYGPCALATAIRALRFAFTSGVVENMRGQLWVIFVTSPKPRMSRGWAAGIVVSLILAGRQGSVAAQVAAQPSGFHFGSYGRVNVASDGRGREGRDADIVAHGSRVDDPTYAELEFRQENAWGSDIKTRIVATLAIFPPLFHYSGQLPGNWAVRQLYAQGSYRDWLFWAGSRMYRGDDIYLLNWWPLDNQNTVGGGVGAKLGAGTTIALHAGMQRLENTYQHQLIPSVAPYGFGAQDVSYLDRPRTIESLKLVHQFQGEPASASGLKAVLYGEAHELPAGIRRDPTLSYDIPLPSDAGFLVGGQLTFYTGERDTFASLFVRYASGLAAYDPLEAPASFANDRSTTGAHEMLVALSSNYEWGAFGILAAAYLRFFRDPGASATSLKKYDEGIVIARPQLYLGEHFGVGLEGSFQSRRYAVLDPATDGPLTASMLRGAVLPYFSPSGRGSFKRPQIGLVYAFTARNAGARSLFPPEDVFSIRRYEHYAGITTEWWFDLSAYP
jgi:hypothetical protein